MKKLQYIILILFCLGGFHANAMLDVPLDTTKNYVLYLKNNNSKKHNKTLAIGDRVTFKLKDGESASGIIGKVSQTGDVTLATKKGRVTARVNIEDVAVVIHEYDKYYLRTRYTVQILEQIPLPNQKEYNDEPPPSSDGDKILQVFGAILLVPFAIIVGIYFFIWALDI